MIHTGVCHVNKLQTNVFVLCQNLQPAVFYFLSWIILVWFFDWNNKKNPWKWNTCVWLWQQSIYFTWWWFNCTWNLLGRIWKLTIEIFQALFIYPTIQCMEGIRRLCQLWAWFFLIFKPKKYNNKQTHTHTHKTNDLLFLVPVASNITYGTKSLQNLGYISIHAGLRYWLRINKNANKIITSFPWSFVLIGIMFNMHVPKVMAYESLKKM